MATQYKTQMDFNAFNALVNPQNTTMKLILARSILQDVVGTFARFNNELAPDAMRIQVLLNQIVEAAKAEGAARRAALEKKAAEAERTTSDEFDNPTGEATHSTDVKDKYDQVAAAKADGVI